MRILNLIILAWFLLITTVSTCVGGIFTRQKDNTPWSIMFYAGMTVKEVIGDIIEIKSTSVHETLFSTELAYSFYTMSWAKLQVAGNLAERFAAKNEYPDAYPIPEADAYLMLRFTKFPWNNIITTNFAIGEGVSYATDVPFPEAYRKTSNKSQELLDFLGFELTFALPSYPQWQLVARIHHRSGCFGLFMAEPYNSGSNTLGIGIRYYF